MTLRQKNTKAQICHAIDNVERWLTTTKSFGTAPNLAESVLEEYSGFIKQDWFGTNRDI